MKRKKGRGSEYVRVRTVEYGIIGGENFAADHRVTALREHPGGPKNHKKIMKFSDRFWEPSLVDLGVIFGQFLHTFSIDFRVDF